jgi:methylglyoxal synthase
MNIVLIAHNKKKELMTEFCIAYKKILMQHSLFATGATGALIIEETGLNIHRVSAGSIGGKHQIASRVALNEIDLVIFLRDNLNTYEHDYDDASIFNLCDNNNIPFATNIATAELLIKAVERGDLAWRELINPIFNT